ncbi:MAG: 50S ribosomal protein L3 [bacterium]
MKFILGKKIGMTQIFNEKNEVVPVTLIKAGPCQVIQVKTKEKDGYEAVQIGFDEMKENKVKKPQKGHFKKAKSEISFRFLREFKGDNLKIGDKIDVSCLNNGDVVKVVGISKGKGFQGVVKRHGFKGGRASHGNKHSLRSPGSIGSAFPERVMKGKRMAGRMGSDRIVVMGLSVVQIDKENDLLAIKGAVPGKIGTLLEIYVVKESKEVIIEEKEKAIEEKKQEQKKQEKETTEEKQ